MDKELEELENIAREATKNCLKHYIIPTEYVNNLLITTLFDNDLRIFKLYIPGKERNDEHVIATATVNRETKTANVEITNLEKK